MSDGERSMVGRTQAMREFACVILAAGKGTRMRSTLPKVLHEIAGRPLLGHVLALTESVGAARTIVVVGHGAERVEAFAAPRPCVVQEPQLGTGHAVMQALPALEGFGGDVMVLFADTPLIEPETIERMRAARAAGSQVVVLGFRADAPGAYGRLVVDRDGGLDRIVEAKDASPAERDIDLCNSGVMLLDGALVQEWLPQIGSDNAKGEYYLTDIVGLARAAGARCSVVEGDETEMLGVNNRVDLSVAEAVIQDRLRERAMLAGVTLRDPASVFLSWDTAFGADVVVEPNVVFRPGVTIGDGAEIRAFSHLEGARVGDNAIIGPFARLRPGAELAADVHIGNFVEIKNADLGSGAKVNHLSYVGDSTIGAGANIGAGTITCNYDGFFKHRTEIGAGAFIGSDTLLVAPVKVGDGAFTGSGSVITEDVPADALALTRPPLTQREGWASRFRDVMSAKKAAAKAGD